MIPSADTLPRKSRLAALLDHFAEVEDPRDVRRITASARRSPASGGLRHDRRLRRLRGDRRLGRGASRLPPPVPAVRAGRPRRAVADDPDEPDQPGLFSAAFSDWVRESWPDRPLSWRSTARPRAAATTGARGAAPLHLVSAFATTARLVLGQEAVPDKANELAAIPVLLERLGAGGRAEGRARLHRRHRHQRRRRRRRSPPRAPTTCWRSRPTSRACAPRSRPPSPRPAAGSTTYTDIDKGHGRIEERRITVLRDIDWLDGDRRFPGELRLPGVACILRVKTEARLADRTRSDTRYFISSAPLTAGRPPTPCAATGRSRTACTGSSTSPSATTSPACARATAPATWRPSATSPSTSSAPPPATPPSSPAERSPDGRQTTLPTSSPSTPRLIGFGALQVYELRRHPPFHARTEIRLVCLTLRSTSSAKAPRFRGVCLVQEFPAAGHLYQPGMVAETEA